LVGASCHIGWRNIHLTTIRVDYEDSHEKDKAAILKYAPQYKDQVYAITIGSEALYRESLDGAQLAKKIKEMKAELPGFKVGTADSWNKYQDGTANAVIEGGADILLVNGFSYWQGQTDANATASFFDDIMQAYGHIQQISGGVDKIELWVGETGE
jgi:glucan 1,3-beta-glucosidase